MSGDNNTLKVTDVDGRPSIFIYETQSGVIFHITPINLPTLRAIQLKAQDKFPYPDKRPYQQLEEKGFAEGQLTPAEENPQYLLDCQTVDHERAQWVDRTIFDYAAYCPKYPTKEAMIDGFREKLTKLREIAVLPEDDYEAILFHLVLTWNQVGAKDGQFEPVGTEFARIVRLAIQTVALTADEVSAGIRFFRPYVSERPARAVAR